MTIESIARAHNACRGRGTKAWLVVSVHEPSLSHEYYRTLHFDTTTSSWAASDQHFNKVMELKYSVKVGSWYLHILEPLGHVSLHMDPDSLHVRGLFRLSSGSEESNLHPPLGSFTTERTTKLPTSAVPLDARGRASAGVSYSSSSSCCSGVRYRHVKTRLLVQIQVLGPYAPPARFELCTPSNSPPMCVYASHTRAGIRGGRAGHVGLSRLA